MERYPLTPPRRPDPPMNLKPRLSLMRQVRRLWGVVQPQVALAGFGPHLQERDARVTLQQRGLRQVTPRAGVVG